MSRPIKFRAFSDKTGMWDWEKLTTFRGGHPLSCLYSHDGWQVMQFTGLKDKNGMDVYEGDVLGACVMNGSVVNAQVTFNGGQFLVSALQGEHWGEELFIHASRCEVIGNVFENPELLPLTSATDASGK